MYVGGTWEYMDSASSDKTYSRYVRSDKDTSPSSYGDGGVRFRIDVADGSEIRLGLYTTLKDKQTVYGDIQAWKLWKWNGSEWVVVQEHPDAWSDEVHKEYHRAGNRINAGITIYDSGYYCLELYDVSTQGGDFVAYYPSDIDIWNVTIA